MTAEILSIIAVCISGVTAICAATIPAILSYKNKKVELGIQIKQSKQKEYEAKFEIFFNEHINIIKKLSELYGQWKTDAQKASELISFIYKIANEFNFWMRCTFYYWAQTIIENADNKEIERMFNECMGCLLASYGIDYCSNSTKFLMSDMLKIVLRERFDELQNSSSKDFKLSILLEESPKTNADS